MLRSEFEPGAGTFPSSAEIGANGCSGGLRLRRGRDIGQWAFVLLRICCVLAVVCACGALAVLLVAVNGRRALLRLACGEVAVWVMTGGLDGTGLAARADRAPAEVDEKES